VTPGARLGGIVLSATVLITATGCRSEPGLDAQSISAATVRVRADGCGPRTELGTGTVIPDGLVITAAHVVAGADLVAVVDRSGDTIASEVVAFDPVLDVAALRPVAESGRPVVLRADPGRAGERGLVALVDTDGSVATVAIDVLQRVTIDTTDIYRDAPVQRRGLRVAVAIEPGDSGAMVHLPGGGVGIVWSRSTSNDDQAWTVDLPSQLSDSATRRSLVAPVDTGSCR
jgi:S1-C subfamily serine protease